MEVNCAGCAGCCLDWRPLVSETLGELRGERPPFRPGADGADDHRPPRRRASLDGVANLVPLTRDEVRAFVEAGLADALTPRLWEADDDDPAVTIDDYRVAAIAGRPAFFVGVRKPPKPIAPFDREEATWLPACIFLDPTTLQCRIHDDDLYPAECSDYPAHNLALDQETECERVERAFGGERLLSADVEDESDLEGFLLGPQAIGGKVFCYPRPDELDGVVRRIARSESDREDRAEFVAVAAASSPGTLAISDPHYDSALERALAADSWAGQAIDEWTTLAVQSDREDVVADSAIAERIEDDRGAPETPGWDAVDGSAEGDE